MRSDATYFKNFKFEGFHNIGDFELSCEKPDGSVNQWTVLLGNNNTGKTSILKAIAKYDKPNFDIYAYGVSRYPATTNLTESVGEPCESLFNPSTRLINVEEWIMQMRVAISDGNNDIKRKFDIFHSVVCDGKLFPEIYDFKTESDGFQSKVLFKTDDGWFKYNELGFGYQSMLSWVADFCFRMFMKYPNSENPLAEPAIVLLDEIDQIGRAHV